MDCIINGDTRPGDVTGVGDDRLDLSDFGIDADIDAGMFTEIDGVPVVLLETV